MTDRLHSLTVVLDRDIRDDDCKATIDAIGQVSAPWLGREWRIGEGR